MNRVLGLAASVLVLSNVLLADVAFAHVDLEDSYGNAGQRQILTFTVGHGCEGADTVGVRINLPPEITAVRAMPADSFGLGNVITDAAEVPVAVEWTKTDARDGDDQFYSMAIRITVPDAPFTSLAFPSIQTCRDSEGVETTVAWDGTAEPAPVLMVLPARRPGWNRFTVPASVTDLSVFDGAQIVWQGDAAYSSNPTTMELIANEPDVTVLASLEPGSDVWVKY